MRPTRHLLLLAACTVMPACSSEASPDISPADAAVDSAAALDGGSDAHGDGAIAADAPGPSDGASRGDAETGDAGTQPDVAVQPDATSLPDASGDSGADDATSGDAATDGDAGADLLGAGATSGMLTGADLGVDISGTGTSPIGAISITGGHGTIEVAGEGMVQAVVMEHQPFDPYQLYQIVAIAPDRLMIFWAYCQTGSLTSEYWEDSREQSASDGASGTCTEHLGRATVPAMFPAFAFPPPAPISTFTVTATGLTYDGQHPGTLVDQGVTYGLYPFHTVDCSACAATPAQGWQELHSFLSDPHAGTLSVGIIYLFPAAAAQNPELAYTLAFPTLGSLPPASFPGTWTGPPGTMKRLSGGRPLPFRAPPR